MIPERRSVGRQNDLIEGVKYVLDNTGYCRSVRRHGGHKLRVCRILIASAFLRVDVLGREGGVCRQAIAAPRLLTTEDGDALISRGQFDLTVSARGSFGAEAWVARSASASHSGANAGRPGLRGSSRLAISQARRRPAYRGGLLRLAETRDWPAYRLNF